MSIVFQIYVEYSDKLDSDDAVAVEKYRTLVKVLFVEANLIYEYIRSNCGFLSAVTTRLESSGLILSVATSIVEKIKLTMPLGK